MNIQLQRWKMCRSSTFFFLLISQLFFSQFTISGKILNEINSPISRANIQLLTSDSTVVTYTRSNSNGEYNLKSTEKNVILKVTALSYKPKFKNIVLSQDLEINLSLTTDEKEIKEVIIFAQPAVAKLRNDSISFNLKAVRDSTERNLGDLIKKLPGLDIGSDGKVKFQGKNIDKILIDGNDFFGSQHKMATENITADMVEGLDLLLRHQEDKNKKDFNVDDKTVLNVRLKDKYRGEVLGNIALYGGIEDKFNTKTNLFKFSKKGNISLISNANNIGEAPMSVQDYLELIGVINKITSSSESTSNVVNVDEFIPKYIFTEEKVKEKTNYFSALNYTYKFSNKLKINGNTIFNQTNQLEQFSSTKTFITTNGSQILNEEKTNSSRNFVLSSYLNFDYKPTKNLSLNYNIIYNPTSEKGVENILSTTNFKNNSKNINQNLGQELNVTQRISENILFTSILSNSYSNRDKNLLLTADQAFLGLVFKNNNFDLEKNVKLTNLNFGINNNIIYKHNKDSYKLMFNYDYSDQIIKSQISTTVQNYADFLNNLTSRLNILTSGFTGRNFFSKFFIQYGFNIKSNNIKSISDEKNLTTFEPNLAINYEINAINKVSLSYAKSNKRPGLFQTISNSYIENYQNIITPSSLQLFQFSPTDSYDFTLNNFNSKKERFITFTINYTQSKKIFSTNTSYINNYVTSTNVTAPFENNVSFLVLYDKKFTKIPFSLKTNFSYSIGKSENFIQNIENKYNTTNYSTSIKIISNFKKSKFQIHFNYLLSNYLVKQSLNNLKNNIVNQEYTYNFLGVFKRLKFDFENTLLLQNSNVKNRNQFLISPKIYYYSKDNKWEFGLETQNILHLHENIFLTQSTSNYYFENDSTYTIPGNILIGVKYNL